MAQKHGLCSFGQPSLHLRSRYTMLTWSASGRPTQPALSPVPTHPANLPSQFPQQNQHPHPPFIPTPTNHAIIASFHHRIHREASWRGGTGAGWRSGTRVPAIGVRRKWPSSGDGGVCLKGQRRASLRTCLCGTHGCLSPRGDFIRRRRAAAERPELRIKTAERGRLKVPQTN
jgi:hypothetical protein